MTYQTGFSSIEKRTAFLDERWLRELILILLPPDIFPVTKREMKLEKSGAKISFEITQDRPCSNPRPRSENYGQSDRELCKLCAKFPSAFDLSILPNILEVGPVLLILSVGGKCMNEINVCVLMDVL